MAGRGYASEDRVPTRPYTPSGSEDEMEHFSEPSFAERDYRLFQFRKEGRSWAQNLCTESTTSETEIKKRAKRNKKPTHNIDQKLAKMSPPRRHAIEDLLDRIHRKDLDRDQWEIVSIDNENPEWTKRNGEVLAFSVILARVGASTTRQRTASMSQNRRTSAYLSPERDYAVPERRRPKSYHQSHDTRDRRSPRRSDTFRKSDAILEDDPFGSAPLFSNDGKPVNATGSAPFNNSGLPPHIPIDQPIGAKSHKQDQQDSEWYDSVGGNSQKQGKQNNEWYDSVGGNSQKQGKQNNDWYDSVGGNSQKQGKQKKSKKPKKGQDDDIVDLDALLGTTGLGSDGDDLLNGGHHDDHEEHDLDFDSPIEVIGDHETKSRGRKRADSGWHETTPKQGMSRSKSKSKPRRPSLHIPRDEKYRRAIPEVTTASGGRRQQRYYGSHGSATTPSIHSDQSVLEAEYEEYSSSGSSAGWQEAHQQDWPGQYMPTSGRYTPATKAHRRGPPSPQHVRYESADHGYIPQSATTRRPPRQERFPSDGALQRYSFTPVAATRPPLIMQHSAPKFTPMSAHPATSMYTYDAGITPFPGEMVATTPLSVPSALHRRDTAQEHAAQLYMQRDQETAREIELLQRERDLARREAEMHHEFARRASVRTSTSKYNHEPRLMPRERRYSEYHG